MYTVMSRLRECIKKVLYVTERNRVDNRVDQKLLAEKIKVLHSLVTKALHKILHPVECLPHGNWYELEKERLDPREPQTFEDLYLSKVYMLPNIFAAFKKKDTNQSFIK